MKRVVLVMLAGALAAGVSAAQDLERLFKAAVNTETVDRNCTAAIEQYKKVAAGSNRAVAAQALIRMAGCYQQLRDGEAQQVYERIVREYSDQPDAVALARTRLSSRVTSRPPDGDRIVKSGPDTWGGPVSPDGRYLAYVDYNDMAFKVHDLATGITRPVPACAASATFSPDGRQLACGGSGSLGIRIVDLSASREPRVVHTNSDVDIFFPGDWSRDGKSIAVVARRKDRTRQIGVLDIDDGSFRVLKTVGWRGPNKIALSPDGKYLAYDLPASETDAQPDVFIIAVDGSGEKRVVGDPADDVVMAWSGDGEYILFASNRNGPVGLWAQPVIDGGAAAPVPTLVKRDIGTVDSLGLTATGTLYVAKSASTISLQIAPIDLTAGRLTGPATVQIYGADTPSWSPDGTTLAYAKTGFLAIHDLQSNAVRELRPRLLYMPQPTWFPDGRSLVVWGRDLNGRGVIERINAETGEQTFITDAYDIQQVQVSPDGKKIYYSIDVFNGNRPEPARFVERDLTTAAVRDVSPGRLSPDGKFVAAVELDGKTNMSALVVSATDGGGTRRIGLPFLVEEFRASPQWTADGEAMLVVETTAEYAGRALWLVPVSGGSPRKLNIDISDWIVGQGIRLHPNGTQIAYFTGEGAREVWALENVLPGTGR